LAAAAAATTLAPCALSRLDAANVDLRAGPEMREQSVDRR
jgi:hypothetical protein